MNKKVSLYMHNHGAISFYLGFKKRYNPIEKITLIYRDHKNSTQR